MRWCTDPRNADALAASVFTLAPKLQAAMDQGGPKPPSGRLSFALASCQYPPGLFDAHPAAAAHERLRADAATPDGPQFLVLCGDQVYLDETAGAFDPIAAASGSSDVQDAPIDRSYELTWRLPPMRATVARLPVVAMFDDHEIENDWKGLDAESDPPREEVRRALAAYERHQGLLNPARPLVADAAAGRSFVSHPGGVPLIVLDTRSRRSLRDATNIREARIVRADVMQALRTQLAGPGAAALVKLIVSPSPILPPEQFDATHPAERLRSDTWSGYPASTVELLSFIRDHDIRRVVFLAGDAHLSSVSSLQFDGPGGANRVVSVVSSGLYTPWPFVNQRPEELVLHGAVDLGWSGNAFKGTMTLHAMSAHAGHAVVSIIPGESGNVWLDVSLRAAHGATTDCRVELR
jgi:phosphodiesterase/alkaline phosphatase D-like protein